MPFLTGDVTPASRAIFAAARPSRAPARRRRRAAATRPARRRKTARRASRPARLVKGSAAAKRYMASIRRKRRK